MKKSRITLWLILLALVATGVILRWMAPATEDDFPHRLSGLLRELHGLSAALGLMIFGYMLAEHVQKKLAKHKRAWDGYAHLGLWILLIASGLLLYYPQEFFEALGLNIPALHWYAGLILGVLFPLHFWRKALRRRWFKFRFKKPTN
jgi:nitrate reductase gamma subunit